MGQRNEVSKKIETKKKFCIILYLCIGNRIYSLFTSGCLTIRLRSYPLNLDQVMLVRKGK